MIPTVVEPPRQTSTPTKIRLALWKNFLIQKRHLFHTTSDIFMPVLLFLLFAWIRSKEDIFTQRNVTRYPLLALNQIPSYHTYIEYSSLNDHSNKHILFSPKNSITQSVMENVARTLNVSVKGVGRNLTESIFWQEIAIAAVEFDHPDEIFELPKKLSYSIRLPAYYNFQTYRLFKQDTFDKPFEINSTGTSSSQDFPYYLEGFLSIQNAIACEFIKMWNSSANVPDIKMSRFPYPPYKTDEFVLRMQQVAPIFSSVCFYYTLVITTRIVSTDKEERLKEFMKMMGSPMWIHWLSWFVRTIIMLFISMLAITLLLKKRWFGASIAIFPNSNIVCLLVFFMAYSISITTYSYLVSILPSKVQKATIVASLVISFVSLLTSSSLDDFSDWMKVLLCICPDTGMGYGILLIVRLENAGPGLDWSTFSKVLFVYDTLSVWMIVEMFLLTSFIYFGLTLFVRNGFPRIFIIAKSWKCNNDNHCSHSKTNSNDVDPNNFESEPMDRLAVIKVCNLNKKYGTELVVDGLSMNMYENQITVLLGHNGAGKTTTISMLTGMIRPSTGTAMINGHDICSSTNKARNSMGFCSQNNILFDDLTVREHIILYSQLKGFTDQEAESEVKRYTRVLGLQDKIDAQSKTLSGGQQRKLSLGIALCGRSKVVFLDEPTSGVDVDARRAFWDILLAEKENRTILLTTHCMEEADVLGDRIAIMAKGKLKCCGSSFFLKKRFGTGYRLICAKDTGCNSIHVTELLQKYLPDTRVETENETELFYQMPDTKVSLFENIFKALEDNGTELKLKSFGVSMTTLEEVFLKFTSGSNVTNGSLTSHTDNENVSNGENNDLQTTLEHPRHLLKGRRLALSQINAMFKKRFLCWLRTWKLFTCLNIFGIVCLIPTAFDLRVLFNLTDEPPIDLTLDLYREPIVFVEDIKNGTTPAANILLHYQDEIRSYPNAELLLRTHNFEHEVISWSKDNYIKYQSQLLAGASALSSGTLLFWYNNQALHSAAISLNHLHKATMKWALGKEYGVNVKNKPLPPRTTRMISDDIFILAIPIVMSTYLASYGIFYTKENECKSKLIQFTSDVNLFIFWLTSIFWDLLSYTFTIMIVSIMLAIHRYTEYSYSIDLLGELLLIFLFIFLYGLAMLPVIYVISLIFSNPSRIIGTITVVNTIVMVFYILEHKQPLDGVLPKLVRIYPMWSFVRCVSHFEPTIKPRKTVDDWKYSSGKSIGLGIGAFTVLILIERGALKHLILLALKLIPRKLPEIHAQQIDDDLAIEKTRIDAMSDIDLKAQTLVMQNVSKFYGRFLAVNQISFAVKPGECFGLIGNNGAGKTTIFKMLIGELLPSFGRIFVNEKIGYCPQFDGLLIDLTARESLEMFAMIRGVPRADIHNYILRVANSLDFVLHIDKKVNHLSGGNKRKLSTAIALIGDPSIILLDEPTTGMDPAAKRSFWNVIIKLRESGKLIILTSHSMEECEALCTRITVLVNGNCKCLGSIQHLKHKFTDGFQLKVKVAQTVAESSLQLSKIKQLIPRVFGGAVLREEYQGILTYHIQEKKMKWSTVFKNMENVKRTTNIEDYSISQNSLEQVVLGFIKDQHSLEKKN